MSPQSENPLLSVVIPAYNSERFMPGLMDSVRAAVAALSDADRAHVEVIFCDNHSTDRTGEMAGASSPGCAYRVVRPPQFYENRTENWRHGLAQARGAWMMMLHADDLFAPGGLAALLPVCRRAEGEKRPGGGETVLLSGRHRTFADDRPPGRLRPAWPLPAVLGGEALRRRVLPFHCPFVPFITIRRDVYEQVGGLDPQYELVQDWDLWIRILAHGDCRYHPGEVGHWRTHPLGPKYRLTFAREHLLLALRMGELIPGLDVQTAARSVQAHVARVHALLPETPAEDLLEGTPFAGRIAEERRSLHGQEAAFKKQQDERATRELNRIRASGLSRALLTR